MKLLTNNQKLTGAFIAGAALAAAGIILLQAFKKCRSDNRFLSRYDTIPEAEPKGEFTHFFKEGNEQE
jgi:hypothetical protein